MQERKVGIVAECVCDLPSNMLAENDVELVYFWIETGTGVFSDTDEITAENVLEYLAAGGEKAISTAPSPEVYRKSFEKSLAKYEEVILLSISPEISDSYVNAKKAVESMGEKGKRVSIFPSEHLSSGIGFLVLRAAELANKGAGAADIMKALQEMNGKITTSFIAGTTEYLYRKGLIAKWLNVLCTKLNVHPILMMKKGKIGVYSYSIGEFDQVAKKYIKSLLRSVHNINRKRCFVTYAGCSAKRLETIVDMTKRIGRFEEVQVVKASATVSSNCGENTFGVIIVED